MTYNTIKKISTLAKSAICSKRFIIATTATILLFLTIVFLVSLVMLTTSLVLINIMFPGAMLLRRLSDVCLFVLGTIFLFTLFALSSSAAVAMHYYAPEHSEKEKQEKQNSYFLLIAVLSLVPALGYLEYFYTSFLPGRHCVMLREMIIVETGVMSTLAAAAVFSVISSVIYIACHFPTYEMAYNAEHTAPMQDKLKTSCTILSDESTASVGAPQTGSNLTDTTCRLAEQKPKVMRVS